MIIVTTLACHIWNLSNTMPYMMYLPPFHKQRHFTLPVCPGPFAVLPWHYVTHVRSSFPFGCQMYDMQISHSLTLLYRRFLTFCSIHSLLQASSEHARSSVVSRSLFMLLLSLRYYVFIRSLSVLLSRILSCFLTAGTEDWDLGKRAGFMRATFRHPPV